MQQKEIKLGSLVVWNPTLARGPGNQENPWSDWVGLVIREIPGTDERKVVAWNIGPSGGQRVITSPPKRDLRLAYEQEKKTD